MVEDRYIFEDHLLDEMADYLKENDISDLLELVGDAVSFLENKNYAKESELHGNVTDIVDFCKKNTIPDGTLRRKILFREIAIWAVENGMGDKEIDELDAKIISNCPGRKSGEIKGWISWVKQHKPKQNIKSLRWFIKRVNSLGGADNGKD